MKRNQWMLAGASLLLAGSLAACSSSTASNNTKAEGGDTSAEQTKLVYWSIDRHDSDFIEQKISEYEGLNPNVDIEFKVMADNYAQSVDIAFSSKQAPDILRVDTGNVPAWVKKGYLESFDSYITPEMKSRFESVLINEKNMVDGKIYTLPNIGQFWRLIYNVDLFEKAGITEPPATLAEMVEDAKKITEAGKDSGAYGFAGNFKSGSGFERIAHPITTLSKTEGTEGFNFQTAKFDFGMYKETLEALRQIVVDGSMMPGSESLDIDPLRAQFAQGKIGMYFNHSVEPSVYKTQFPTEIRWAAALPPTVDGQQNGASQVISGSYLAMSKDSGQKEAAWKFIEWMYSDEVQIAYQEGGYGVSVIPSVAAAAKAPDIPGIEDFLPTKYDGIYPATPFTATEGRLEGTKKMDVFNRYIFTGGDLDKDLQDLNTRYNAALDKAKAAGDTTIEAQPDFSAASLQGSLVKE
ncbi:MULTISPECIES: ABC transporter substrate-binding protein [unclassified Paenibacillus]|uniref:ABC transporter substrate-binding protein n=1 Tax=unclassified Paenibacillus TaxID=185978 RepID=UPI0004F79A21|nr:MULTISPECIES: sugar ABC transporter substrate-binding protein [unclassified Paenibacillus]AIQ32911.1 ABC transporter substrate-binding protein [Paenibacillus sp. FSL P4-0081]OMF28733.1 ABC transporter substrate-binding protein [Paenibacillus sp. FSL H8-0259]